jgi:CRP-like cAMP-binding protein
MKAIAKELTERYPSWLEFGKDLSQAFSGLRLAGETVSDSEKFNKLRDMPFFQDFGDVALWEAIRIGRWRQIDGDTVVIKEGEQGDSVFLLVEGEVGVTLMGKPLATIDKGGCFGEVLYFAGNASKRTTTIVAVDRIVVLEIKSDALRAATDGCQVAFNKAFMRVLIDRLTQANIKLAKR